MAMAFMGYIVIHQELARQCLRGGVKSSATMLEKDMDGEPVRLSHAELLLLDLVEEYGIWVRGVSQGSSWASNNKAGCDAYGVEVWAVAFERLLELGFIEFYEEQRGDVGRAEVARPTREEILRELTRTDVTFDAMNPRETERPVWLYQLTKSGGAVWEQFAQPGWEQYMEWGVATSEEEGEPGKGFAKCVDKNRIELFFHHALNAGLTIEPSTVTWAEEKEWKVRAWKTLPIVHVAEFVARRYESPEWDEMSCSTYWFLHNWKRKF